MELEFFEPGCLIGPLATECLNKEDLSFYSAVSGDLNPIHLYKTAAVKAGFKRELTQGMLLMGLAHSLLSTYLNNFTIVKKYKMKFEAPVYVGERLFLTYLVESCDTTNYIVSFDIEGKNQKGNRVLLANIILNFLN